MDTADSLGKKFERLVEIMDVLRGDEGCPWDREQTELTLVDYFLEEVYEAVDAVLRGEAFAVAEELGDVMMELVFLARVYKEKKAFSLADVLDGINDKMVRRHPHVFGKAEVEGAREVVEVWHNQKQREKKRQYLFEGLSRSAPALLRAYQLGQKASGQGFDWPSAREAFDKVKEEIDELEEALVSGGSERMREEMGDLFFALCNVSRHMGINPELALKQANDTFIERFQFIEKRLKEKGKTASESSLEEMDHLWEEAKRSG